MKKEIIDILSKVKELSDVDVIYKENSNDLSYEMLSYTFSDAILKKKKNGFVLYKGNEGFLKQVSTFFLHLVLKIEQEKHSKDTIPDKNLKALETHVEKFKAIMNFLCIESPELETWMFVIDPQVKVYFETKAKLPNIQIFEDMANNWISQLKALYESINGTKRINIHDEKLFWISFHEKMLYTGKFVHKNYYKLVLSVLEKNDKIFVLKNLQSVFESERHFLLAESFFNFYSSLNVETLYTRKKFDALIREAIYLLNSLNSSISKQSKIIRKSVLNHLPNFFEYVMQKYKNDALEDKISEVITFIALFLNLLNIPHNFCYDEQHSDSVAVLNPSDSEVLEKARRSKKHLEKLSELLTLRKRLEALKFDYDKAKVAEFINNCTYQFKKFDSINAYAVSNLMTQLLIAVADSFNAMASSTVAKISEGIEPQPRNSYSIDKKDKLVENKRKFISSSSCNSNAMERLAENTIKSNIYHNSDEKFFFAFSTERLFVLCRAMRLYKDVLCYQKFAELTLNTRLQILPYLAQLMDHRQSYTTNMYDLLIERICRGLLYYKINQVIDMFFCDNVLKASVIKEQVELHTNSLIASFDNWVRNVSITDILEQKILIIEKQRFIVTLNERTFTVLHEYDKVIDLLGCFDERGPSARLCKPDKNVNLRSAEDIHNTQSFSSYKSLNHEGIGPEANESYVTCEGLPEGDIQNGFTYDLCTDNCRKKTLQSTVIPSNKILDNESSPTFKVKGDRISDVSFILRSRVPNKLHTYISVLRDINPIFNRLVSAFALLNNILACDQTLFMREIGMIFESCKALINLKWKYVHKLQLDKFYSLLQELESKVYRYKFILTKLTKKELRLAFDKQISENIAEFSIDPETYAKYFEHYDHSLVLECLKRSIDDMCIQYLESVICALNKNEYFFKSRHRLNSKSFYESVEVQSYYYMHTKESPRYLNMPYNSVRLNGQNISAKYMFQATGCSSSINSRKGNQFDVYDHENSLATSCTLSTLGNKNSAVLQSCKPMTNKKCLNIHPPLHTFFEIFNVVFPPDSQLFFETIKHKTNFSLSLLEKVDQITNIVLGRYNDCRYILNILASKEVYSWSTPSELLDVYKKTSRRLSYVNKVSKNAVPLFHFTSTLSTQTLESILTLIKKDIEKVVETEFSRILSNYRLLKKDERVACIPILSDDLNRLIILLEIKEFACSQRMADVCKLARLVYPDVLLDIPTSNEQQNNNILNEGAQFDKSFLRVEDSSWNSEHYSVSKPYVCDAKNQSFIYVVNNSILEELKDMHIVAAERFMVSVPFELLEDTKSSYKGSYVKCLELVHDLLNVSTEEQFLPKFKNFYAKYNVLSTEITRFNRLLKLGGYQDIPLELSSYRSESLINDLCSLFQGICNTEELNDAEVNDVENLAVFANGMNLNREKTGFDTKVSFDDIMSLLLSEYEHFKANSKLINNFMQGSIGKLDVKEFVAFTSKVLLLTSFLKFSKLFDEKLRSYATPVSYIPDLCQHFVNYDINMTLQSYILSFNQIEIEDVLYTSRQRYETSSYLELAKINMNKLELEWKTHTLVHTGLTDMCFKLDYCTNNQTLENGLSAKTMDGDSSKAKQNYIRDQSSKVIEICVFSNTEELENTVLGFISKHEIIISSNSKYYRYELESLGRSLKSLVSVIACIVEIQKIMVDYGSFICQSMNSEYKKFHDLVMKYRLCLGISKEFGRSINNVTDYNNKAKLSHDIDAVDNQVNALKLELSESSKCELPVLQDISFDERKTFSHDNITLSPYTSNANKCNNESQSTTRKLLLFPLLSNHKSLSSLAKEFNFLAKRMKRYISNLRHESSRLFFVSDDNILRMVNDKKHYLEVLKHVYNIDRAIVEDFCVLGIISRNEKVLLLSPVSLNLEISGFFKQFDLELRSSLQHYYYVGLYQRILSITDSKLHSLEAVKNEKHNVFVASEESKKLHSNKMCSDVRVLVDSGTLDNEITLITFEGLLNILNVLIGDSYSYGSTNNISLNIPAQIQELIDEFVFFNISSLPYNKKLELLIKEMQIHGEDVYTLFPKPMLHVSQNTVSSTSKKTSNLELKSIYQGFMQNSPASESTSKSSFTSSLCIRTIYDIPYQFEYYPPTDIIFTSLTSKVFSSISLSQSTGVILYGRSGTGKTETVKYYCRCIGKPIFIFCCNESCDINTLKRVITGCKLTNSYICFDEFNRLESSVMSSATDLIIDLNIKVFLTMNLGYKGRYELPRSLRNVFCEIMMDEPDLREIVLYYTGSTLIYDVMTSLETKIIQGRNSKRFTEEKQLSTCENGSYVSSRSTSNSHLPSNFMNYRRKNTTSEYYDFGLRAMKTIVSVSNMNLQLISESNNNLSDNKMMRSLIYFYMAALSTNDKNHLRDVIESRFKTKVKQVPALDLLKFGIRNKNGILIVGGASSGKTTLIKNIGHYYSYNPTNTAHPFGRYDSLTGEWIDSRFVRDVKIEIEKHKKFEGTGDCNEVNQHSSLKEAKSLCNEGSETVNGGSYMAQIKASDIKDSERDGNSKIVLPSEKIDVFIEEFENLERSSLLAHAGSKCEILDSIPSISMNEDPVVFSEYVYFVFDSPISSEWVENFNSILDDNRILCLSSGERINIPKNFRFIFETDSLEGVTPATLTRVFLINLEDDRDKIAGDGNKNVISKNSTDDNCTHKLRKNSSERDTGDTPILRQSGSHLDTQFPNLVSTPELLSCAEDILIHSKNRRVIILQGPSGVGKFSLVKNLWHNSECINTLLLDSKSIVKYKNKLVYDAEHIFYVTLDNFDSEQLREYLEYGRVGDVYLRRVLFICGYTTRTHGLNTSQPPKSLERLFKKSKIVSLFPPLNMSFVIIEVLYKRLENSKCLEDVPKCAAVLLHVYEKYSVTVGDIVGITESFADLCKHDQPTYELLFYELCLNLYYLCKDHEASGVIGSEYNGVTNNTHGEDYKCDSFLQVSDEIRTFISREFNLEISGLFYDSKDNLYKKRNTKPKYNCLEPRHLVTCAFDDVSNVSSMLARNYSIVLLGDRLSGKHHIANKCSKKVNVLGLHDPKELKNQTVFCVTNINQVPKQIVKCCKVYKIRRPKSYVLDMNRCIEELPLDKCLVYNQEGVIVDRLGYRYSFNGELKAVDGVFGLSKCSGKSHEGVISTTTTQEAVNAEDENSRSQEERVNWHNSIGEQSNANSFLCKTCNLMHHRFIAFANYFKLVDFYTTFMQVNKRITRTNEDENNFYDKGLNYITNYKKDAIELNNITKTKQQDLNVYSNELSKSLDMIIAKQKDLETEKEKITEYKTKLDRDLQNTLKIKKSIAMKLQDVIPLVEESKNDISEISKSHLSEIKSMIKPPDIIRMTIEAVYYILQNEETNSEGLLDITDDDFKLSEPEKLMVSSVERSNLDNEAICAVNSIGDGQNKEDKDEMANYIQRNTKKGSFSSLHDSYSNSCDSISINGASTSSGDTCQDTLGSVENSMNSKKRAVSGKRSSIKMGNSTCNWSLLSKFIKKDDFISRVRNLGRFTIKPQLVAILDNPSFVLENARKASCACGLLYKWVVATYKYNMAHLNAKPLLDELKGLNENIKHESYILYNEKQKLKDLEGKLGLMKDEYKSKILSLENTKIELEALKTKLTMTNNVIKVLEDEAITWKVKLACPIKFMFERGMYENSNLFIYGNVSKYLNKSVNDETRVGHDTSLSSDISGNKKFENGANFTHQDKESVFINSRIKHRDINGSDSSLDDVSSCATNNDKCDVLDSGLVYSRTFINWNSYAVISLKDKNYESNISDCIVYNKPVVILDCDRFDVHVYKLLKHRIHMKCLNVDKSPSSFSKDGTTHKNRGSSAKDYDSNSNIPGIILSSNYNTNFYTNETYDYEVKESLCINDTTNIKYYERLLLKSSSPEVILKNKGLLDTERSKYYRYLQTNSMMIELVNRFYHYDALYYSTYNCNLSFDIFRELVFSVLAGPSNDASDKGIHLSNYSDDRTISALKWIDTSRYLALIDNFYSVGLPNSTHELELVPEILNSAFDFTIINDDVTYIIEKKLAPKLSISAGSPENNKIIRNLLQVDEEVISLYLVRNIHLLTNVYKTGNQRFIFTMEGTRLSLLAVNSRIIYCKVSVGYSEIKQELMLLFENEVKDERLVEDVRAKLNFDNNGVITSDGDVEEPHVKIVGYADNTNSIKSKTSEKADVGFRKETSAEKCKHTNKDRKDKDCSVTCKNYNLRLLAYSSIISFHSLALHLASRKPRVFGKNYEFTKRDFLLALRSIEYCNIQYLKELIYYEKMDMQDRDVLVMYEKKIARWNVYTHLSNCTQNT